MINPMLFLPLREERNEVGTGVPSSFRSSGPGPSSLDCGGKQRATPLSTASGLPKKRCRRSTLPPHSKKNAPPDPLNFDPLTSIVAATSEWAG